MWWGGYSIKGVNNFFSQNWLAVETLNTQVMFKCPYDCWLSDAGRGCLRGLKGSANMEKHLWSALCPPLSIIRGLRVADDLPGRGRAAHVGGTPPAPRPCQEAKAVVIEQERQTWGKTGNQGLHLNIVQDCQTGLCESDGISRELKRRPHDTI